MPLSPFSTNLVTCQDLLRQVQEDLYIRGSQFLADDVGRISSNLNRLRQQHDAAIEQLQRSNLAFQSKYTAVETELQDAKRAFRLQEAKVQSRSNTIDEQSKNIKRLREALEKTKDGETSAYREGYLAAQGEIKNLEAKNQSLAAIVSQKDQKIKNIKRDLDKAGTDSAVDVAAAYQKGLADGQTKERKKNQQAPPPKPQQQQPKIGILTRERILSHLRLTNTSGESLSANLEAAVKQGHPDVLLAVLQSQHPRIIAPALHIAALFNDIATAEILIKAGADVNESCVASSSDTMNKNNSGIGHVYGVTPMHLAVGAQHEAMIRLLSRHGAHFSFGATPPGKRATGTPAYWLISERWLNMTGQDSSRDVLRILRVMRECRWDPESVVDRKGENLKMVAWRTLSGRPGLQMDVMAFLGGMAM